MEGVLALAREAREFLAFRHRAEANSTALARVGFAWVVGTGMESLADGREGLFVEGLRRALGV